MRLIILAAGFLTLACAQQLPTLYEYYTAGGVTEGLKAPSTGFTLNGLPITIYSGAIHYFRIHPDQWRDRLRKARAAGLNAVETYVPWNLHEPRRGEYDFGSGGNDLSLLLDVRRFVQMAQEEDLFVVFRPGPYICSEWEFGGLPSWLLRIPGIKVRTSDPNFVSAMTGYFDALLPLVYDLIFTRGGPIIALQVENEYGNFGGPSEPRDTQYLITIRDTYVRHGMDSLYFTSDSPALAGDLGAVPGELQTANFDNNPAEQFDALLLLQPDKPLWAMEYWTGWFDHWFEPRHATGNTPQEFADYLSVIFSYNASVNFYMFIGGTSFGFMNGANVIPGDVFPEYAADVSSYDYSAVLTEAGDYTEKYTFAKDLIALNNKVQTLTPAMPAESIKTAYPTIPIEEYLPLSEILNQLPLEDQTTVVSIDESSSMESLPFNNMNGQSYGLILYRTTITAGAAQAELQIIGHVRDIAMVLVDGRQLTTAPTGPASLNDFGLWPSLNASMNLTGLVPGQNHQLDIIVENMGRNNFGTPDKFNEKKGLWEGPILLDGQELLNWEVKALQLKSSFVKGLTGWLPFDNTTKNCPAMFRATLTINSTPTDTFLRLGDSWQKGSTFVNGFPLGRYFSVGPQITSYVPAPFLVQGDNEIIVFEQYSNNISLRFSDALILEKP